MFTESAVMQEMVGNGFGGGPVAGGMSAVSWDPGLRRPYLIDVNGRRIPYVTVNAGIKYNHKTGRDEPVFKSVPLEVLNQRGIYSPVANATSLRKEEWIELDKVVLRAARYRMRAWADLSAANSFGGFNGMSKLILEHETMSDPGEAIVDMNGISEGRTDTPQFQLQGLPLPITHSDFWYDARRLAVSRNTGTPLDTTMGEAAGRRVAEAIEKTTIGIQTGLTYGGNSTYVGGYGRNSSVYGYTNFPARLTRTGAAATAPSNASWTALTTLKEVLACRDALYLNKFFGPFMLYHSNDWDQYLDGDYFMSTTAASTPLSTRTLRERLKAIEGIQDVRRLDFLFASTPSAATGPGGENLAQTYPFTMIMVQMTADVARAINGMDLTTVQWETKGGMQLNFKVLAIAVPQLRADFYGNCFSGDTSIVTRNGNATLKSLVGQDVEVLNRYSKWEKASVKSFGTGKLQRIDFAHLNPVYATEEHRWWMRDGKRITTNELRQVPFTDETLGNAVVKQVSDSGRVEEVFCCVVPESESFTLANGLTTSNSGIMQYTASA